MFMRSWVLHTYHASAFCHLGVSRTVSMLARFFWCGSAWTSPPAVWSGTVKFQARKTSRQTIRWPTLSLPLPNGPGITVRVD